MKQSQVNFDKALTDFNSRQFKTRMKKMAAQVNFFCFLMFFFCLDCKMVPENQHICVNKGITYLRDFESNYVNVIYLCILKDLTIIDPPKYSFSEYLLGLFIGFLKPQ